MKKIARSFALVAALGFGLAAAACTSPVAPTQNDIDIGSNSDIDIGSNSDIDIGSNSGIDIGSNS